MIQRRRADYVSGCRNEGEVIATTSGSNLGGIVGRCIFNATIYDSENMADIICDIDDVPVGGIVGFLNGDYSYYTGYTSPHVYNSLNYGHIETTQPKSKAGGISGWTTRAGIEGCGNHGHIVSESIAGGITPYTYDTDIYSCFNTGHVEGRSSTGGIVGESGYGVYNSWNSGLINTLGGDSSAGGIIGYGNAN